MKAWRVHDWCEPSQMPLEEVAVPEPAAGQIRIRNHAAALNFFDILMVQGKYQVKPPLPSSPGAEVAGVVDAVGEGVKHLRKGDRVHARCGVGGYAEFTVTDAANAFAIPDAMPFEEAAGMIIIYQTTYFALTARTTVKPGEWLLVHGGGGGVGVAAIQLGKALGARVIATAGSDEKLAFCRAQGADHAINYRDESWIQHVKEITGGKGADIIYDPVGGDVFEGSTKCIAPEGRLLVIGFADGRIPTIAANRILLKNIDIVGVYWGGYCQLHPEYMAETQKKLFELYKAGKIRPPVPRTYGLMDAITAMGDLAGRKVMGKAVMKIGS